MIDRKALGMYLNDHLAGSIAGLDAMDRLADASEDTPLSRAMDVLRHRAQQDQDVLRELLVFIDEAERSVAKTFAWIGEKVSRLKLGAESDVEADLTLFEALETLTLGFHGRLALWHVLAAIGGALGAPYDFPGRARQVQADIAVLEQFRLEAGTQAFIAENH